MDTRTDILHALEELEKEDFTIRFQRQLSLKTVDGDKRIPKYRLENKSREETVDLMVQAYTEAGAVAVAVETLQLIRQHDAAKMLLDKYPTAAKKYEGAEAQVKEAILSSALSHHQTIARDGSVSIAPVFSGNIRVGGSINIHNHTNKP